MPLKLTFIEVVYLYFDKWIGQQRSFSTILTRPFFSVKNILPSGASDMHTGSSPSATWIAAKPGGNPWAQTLFLLKKGGNQDWENEFQQDFHVGKNKRTRPKALAS
ncbi:MAG: hypothetical protein R2788_03300 [Saprospiraceae bacterium]